MSILSSLLKLGQGTPTQQIPTAVQTTEIAQELAIEAAEEAEEI